MKKSLFICLFLLSSCSLFKKSESEGLCESSKEFITTINYLNSESRLELSEDQKVEISNEVSKGCQGAAERFIATSKILLTSGFSAGESLREGVANANVSPESFELYMYGFQRSYLRSQLDLTLYDSVEIGRLLRDSIQSNTKVVKRTFNGVVSSCLKREIQTASTGECASIAVEVSKVAEQFNHTMDKEFLDLYSYLSHPREVGLVQYQALTYARELIVFGPRAKENFQTAYRFAISEKGLNLEKARAIEHAKLMSSRSYEKESF